MPVIEPSPDTPQRQENGGISIEATPLTFSVQPDSVCDYRTFSKPPIYMWASRHEEAGVSEETHTPVHEVRFPSSQLDRDDVTFRVTIENQMDRVWRTEGAVIQIGVGGEVESVDQDRFN